MHERDAEALKKQGIEFNPSFILGGQIHGERPRLFNVYAAGNFIEATPDTTYFQIGESKYGKPIIDRVIRVAAVCSDAAKCALISMDSTIRSNLSVGLPLDLVIVRRDECRSAATSHRSTTPTFAHQFRLGRGAAGSFRRAAESRLAHDDSARGGPARTPARATAAARQVTRSRYPHR